LEQAGIQVYDWPFEDGDPPPDSVIEKWLALDTETFGSGRDARIAVHCIAGLGRAPVMVGSAIVGSAEPTQTSFRVALSESPLLAAPQPLPPPISSVRSIASFEPSYK